MRAITRRVAVVVIARCFTGVVHLLSYTTTVLSLKAGGARLGAIAGRVAVVEARRALTSIVPLIPDARAIMVFGATAARLRAIAWCIASIYRDRILARIADNFTLTKTAWRSALAAARRFMARRGWLAVVV